MTYFEDLSEYSYLPDQPPMLNIGWLGRKHSFTVGSVTREVVVALLVLADEPANLMRGFHNCEFCDVDLTEPVEAPVPRGKVWLGNGEIHVRSDDGTVFAAPTLIAHYIGSHGYEPPAAFVEALLREGSNC